MDPAQALAQLGGVARTRDLLALTTERRLRTALAHGTVHRLSHGIYRLAEVDRSLLWGARLNGSVSHLSAALLHGWEVLAPPDRTWVTVQRDAKVRHPRPVQVIYGERDGTVTGCVRTVIDCARRLPFPAALAVADSALRHRDVDEIGLQAAAARVSGRGAAPARRVARFADGRAANPFESTLRALAIEAGLEVEPQGEILAGGRVLHPDLLDRSRRLAIEGESWTYHGGREAFDRDCWRYTVMTLADYRVLRFTHGQVTYDQDWVRGVMHAVAIGRRTEGRSERMGA